MNGKPVLTFDAELWCYSGENAWYFLTLPSAISEEIRAETEGQRRGFGSVRVQVSIGEMSWYTSVFPDSKSGCFVLPIKKQVRRHEEIEIGDVVNVSVQIIELGQA